MKTFGTSSGPELTKSQATELVTPPLEDVILPGVTRDSVLALARGQESGKSKLPGLPEKLVVSERHITMKEVKEAAAEGRLLEVFGSGSYSSYASLICY